MLKLNRKNAAQRCTGLLTRDKETPLQVAEQLGQAEVAEYLNTLEANPREDWARIEVSFRCHPTQMAPGERRGCCLVATGASGLGMTMDADDSGLVLTRPNIWGKFTMKKTLTSYYLKFMEISESFFHIGVTRIVS